MANGIKYQAHEILNKVLNAAETGLQVDIVAGAEYAEDAVHTTADTGNFILGVRNDTLAALGGADGDYVPFQMNASGALFIDTAAGGVLQSAVDGLETLITSTNSKIDIFDAVLDSILTKNTEIDAVLDTIKIDTEAIETAVELLDNAISGTEMQVDVVAPLPAGSNTIGVVDLGVTDNAVLDTIDAVLDTIKTDTGTIDVDTDAINTATVASQAALEKMLYGNALAVTAVHGGSDHVLGATYESLYIGVGGDVVVTMVGTGNFTFKNVASGQLLPIRITHVIATNTTATNIVALKA